MSLRLYEIADEYRRVAELIDDSGGELTPEVEAAFDAAKGSLEAKCDACAALVRESEAESAAYQAESIRLSLLKSVASNRAGRIKAYLLQSLKAAGAGKVKGPRFSVAPRVASMPSIRWEGGGDPPFPFAVYEVKLNAKAAYEAYKSGTLPEGFTVKHSEYVDIR